MGAWGSTAWANDSALDWAGDLGDDIAKRIDKALRGQSNSTRIAAADLLNRLTPYGKRDGIPVWLGIPPTLHYNAERQKLYSLAVAGLTRLRDSDQWRDSWRDGVAENAAEITRILRGLKRKVKHEG